MIIVITSQNRRHITPHAGKCRKFWKYELKDGKVMDKQLIEVEKEASFSQSGEVLENDASFSTSKMGELWTNSSLRWRKKHHFLSRVRC
jgi:hypothetical protein